MNNVVPINSDNLVWGLPYSEIIKKENLEKLREVQLSTHDMHTLLVSRAAFDIASGFVDSIAMSIEGIDKGIEAAKEMAEKLENAKERIKALAKQAVEVNKKPIEGLAYVIRLQNNSQEKIEIEREQDVPMIFKKIKFDVSKTVGTDDEEQIDYWTSVILKKTLPVSDEEMAKYGPHIKLQILDSKNLNPSDALTMADHCRVVVDEAGIRELFKSSKEMKLPGVKREHGQHVRIAKMSAAKAAKNQKKTISAELSEGENDE